MNTKQVVNKKGIQYLHAARQIEARSLVYLLGRVKLVISISRMVHALQRERGASSIFVASDGSCFLEQLKSLIGEANREIETFHEQLDANEADIEGCSRLMTRLALAVHSLEELDQIRSQVIQLKTSTLNVPEHYTAVIRALLAVIFEVADTSCDPETTRALVALFYFIQGKEYAGQERAVGCVRLASGKLETQHIEKLNFLVDGQDRCFEIFCDHACNDILSEWQNKTENVCLESFLKMRSIITLPDDSAIKDVSLSEDWFDICTQRIDAMKAIEESLEHRVEAISEQRLQLMNKELEAFQLNKGVLSDREFVSFAHVANSAELEPLELVAPVLQRPVMELLQEQSRSLQESESALRDARSALEERKLLDQAKLILMKQHGMSEQQAHSLMRKTSMTQGRKLIDVAQAVIEMKLKA